MCLTRSRLLLHAANDRDQRQEQSDYDGSHHDREKNNHDGLEQRSEARKRAIDLVVIHLGDLQKHFRELPGFFTDIDHADDHRRKDAARLQGMHDRFTFFHAVVDFHDGVGDNGIPRGFAGDIERLKNRNAARDQRSQRAAEARNGALASQIAEERRLQL